MEQLEKKINYIFKNKDLLHQALIHSSYANEKHLGENKDYEQLEFLGDAVLQLVSSDYILKVHSDFKPGQLSTTRASLVSESALSTRAREIGIGQYILLGKGEKLTGGADKDRILCNVIESIIGAIYKDSGFKSAEYFINNFILNNKEIIDTDFKTKLQILLGGKDQLLEYRVIKESGADNEKEYTVQVFLDGVPMGTGTGTTKKKAEQCSAEQCIKNMAMDNCEQNK